MARVQVAAKSRAAEARSYRLEKGRLAGTAVQRPAPKLLGPVSIRLPPPWTRKPVRPNGAPRRRRRMGSFRPLIPRIRAGGIREEPRRFRRRCWGIATRRPMCPTTAPGWPSAAAPDRSVSADRLPRGNLDFRLSAHDRRHGQPLRRPAVWRGQKRVFRPPLPIALWHPLPGQTLGPRRPGPPEPDGGHDFVS